MEAKNDAYYIAKVLGGDIESFAPLVDKYKQLAFSLSLKITKNREDAEEVAQDSFLKAYRSLDAYKGGAAFKTWFFRIVYTTAISKVRRKRQNLISYDDYRLTDQELLECEEAVGQFTAEERASYLYKAMDLLDPDERAILNLYYFEQLPVDEVAEIVDLSPSNIKVKLFRSRKKLYEQLHGLLRGKVLSDC